MKLQAAVAVLIGFLLAFGQSATSSSPERGQPDGSDSEEAPNLPVAPGSRIYFHSVKNGELVIGPRLSANGTVTVYTVGEDKISVPRVASYSVLKSGVLVPRPNEVGGSSASKVLKSRSLTFYAKGFRGILIPVDVLYSRSKQRTLVDGAALLAKQRIEREGGGDEGKAVTDEAKPRKGKKVTKADDVSSKSAAKSAAKSALVAKGKEEEKEVYSPAPDKNCNGEVTMFILKSDGVLQRMPPDPYLPMGIQLSFAVKDDFLIRPRALDTSHDLVLNYLTGKNGDLLPLADNAHKLQTEEGDLVSFMLGECGSLIPVREERDHDEHINYYYDGHVIHRSRQFPETFSTSEVVVVNDERRRLPGTDSAERKGHSIRKRSLYPDEIIISSPSSTSYYQSVGRPPPGRPPLGHPPMSHPPMSHPPMSHPPVSRQPVNRPPVSRPPVGCPSMNRPPADVPHMMARQPNQQMMSRPPLPPSTSAQEILKHPRFYLQQPPPGPPPVGRPPPMIGPVRDAPFPPMRPPVVPPEMAVPPMSLAVPVSPPRVAGGVADSTMTLDSPGRLRVRTDLFVNDERGNKIPLIPEVTDQNDIVLFKLTCKGNLVRYPPCKEPEFGFEINFQLLLDELILVPITNNNRPMHMTYVLKENGDLAPLESNENTFKKAPGSLLYFMLGKNNVLFPVQQKVCPDGCVSYYYQDHHLVRLPSTANKPLHFSTLGRPTFAYVNGVTVITCSSQPRLKSNRGSNWKKPDPDDDEIVSKDIFLAGPAGQLIKVSPYKTKTGSTVIYEMDSNGILYRSPKDKKRCIILKTYILLKEGILLPSNETMGYMYMTSKNGDMFPYLYPEGKLEAPATESLKYLLCERGVLLPVELEIVNGHLCYFFHDVVVYKERVYCKDTLSDTCFKLHFKNECDMPVKTCEKKDRSGIKPFTDSAGNVVYYEKEKGFLRRYPPDTVPSYLCYTVGSFEILPDGSLIQVRYQEPDEEVTNLMLKPNGDLVEDTRNEQKLRSTYYILDVNGNLIAVDGRKTRKSIYFYKNGGRVCRVKLGNEALRKGKAFDQEQKKTPLGRDPLNLMDDPEPKCKSNEPQSLYIPVPLTSLTIESSDQAKGSVSKSKCEGLKETMALELEINDDIIEDIKNWAARCDKLLTRREVEESLTEVLKGLNVAGLLKDEAEAR